MTSSSLPTLVAGNRTARSMAPVRVRAAGKFLYLGDTILPVRGVTYGPFRPGPDGCEYHDRERVARDFARMAAAGLNCVRTYTVPPQWLLDVAAAQGLHVLVGLAWEQHVTFLDDRAVRERIVASVRAGVRACAGHPAVLAFTIGNEIPAPIVRWHGHGPIERFLHRLYRTAKAEDPAALVTYVSYPTTEYLDLPFLDFVSFNVFLESEEKLAHYLAHLQHIAGERPLVMAEVGLDSLRNGERRQADTLAWQIRTACQAGCAGTFVFAWTDEWFRGGCGITDWAFGLVDRRGREKPALTAVRAAFAAGPRATGTPTPRVSVVVCTFNGARTIRQCLDAVLRIDYPDFEVVVVNDGSTDTTPAIVAEYADRGVRRIDIANGGLSNARNVGMRAATGEVVAYIDDDAFPEPCWLSFLMVGFLDPTRVGVGGPNLHPPGNGIVAECVAHAPGGPSHVLRDDLDAEHLPGCNMAFRRAAILAIDGFDVRFRIAGDDVDLCWRLLERGGTLGFSPGAMVWHHRRNDVRRYLRQQLNYGRAEGMLEAKWPDKHNRLGHMRWAGRLYGKGHTRPLSQLGRRIDHGVWGTHLFQSMYAQDTGTLWSLTLMPEWHLLSVASLALALLGLSWPPLAWPGLAALLLTLSIPVVQACLSASKARFAGVPPGSRRWWQHYLLTVALHILQPMARLVGRLQYRLTPWRLHGERGWAMPLPRRFEHWSGQWRSQSDWLLQLERNLQLHRVLTRRGGPFDRWDLQADCGLLGGVRARSTVEEHGTGRQLLRVAVWPRPTRSAVAAVPLFALLAVLAASDHAWTAAVCLAVCALVLAARSARECSAAFGSFRLAVRDLAPQVVTPLPSLPILPARSNEATSA